jgi:hypothetical protein
MAKFRLRADTALGTPHLADGNFEYFAVLGISHDGSLELLARLS